jgi:hypothetical protein
MSGLVFELISGLVGGLSSDLLDKQILSRPNQGIRHSTRNSVLVGLVSGLVSGLVFGLLAGLVVELIIPSINGQIVGLVVGPVVGLSIGLSLGLSNGGTACIQHAVLRTFLWRAGYIPWNYSRFLDYAAEHILLRKVGGGYIFVHRLLLDYFASLHATSLAPWAAGAPGHVEACICGYPYHPGARFCTRCGEPRREASAEQIQDISS